jgi:succinyl-diaminopimelate desuccinylase
MKCGTSASAWTYIYLHRLRDRLSGRLTLTCVSDEETGGTWGAKWLVDTFPDEFRGDCMLNGEPSVPNMIRFGEKGTLRVVFKIDTPGAHAAYTHLSPNAIRIAADLIRDPIHSRTCWSFRRIPCAGRSRTAVQPSTAASARAPQESSTVSPSARA